MDENLFENNDLEKELLEESEEEHNANENGEQQNADGGKKEENEQSKEKKKIIRKPQPKLNPERICGTRGIPILPELFENVKFKGKGYEKEDLNELMSKYEHWAHRLFPSLQFDTVLERIEKLGSKKPVQVCVKKMRLDLPILNDDFVAREIESDNENETRNGNLVEERSSSDLFDDLLKATNKNRPSISTQNNFTQSQADQSTVLPKPKTILTDEIKKRIEKNRQLAIEKRLEWIKRRSMLEKGPFETKTNEIILNKEKLIENEVPETISAELNKNEVPETISAELNNNNTDKEETKISDEEDSFL